MSENIRLEMAGRVSKVCIRAIFVTYFNVTLVIVGLFAVCVPIFFPGTSRNSDGSLSLVGHIAEGVGEAILVAGVVTTFMRFFASFDIVGEKIQSWLTDERYLDKLAMRTTAAIGGKVEGWLTDERYLEKVAAKSALAISEPQRLSNIADMRKTWYNISLAMTRQAFPEIAEKVYLKTLDQLVKASEEYYIDFYDRKTTLHRIAGKPNFVEIEHELSLDVIANQHNDSTMFRARFLLDKFSDKSPKVDYFRADGKTRSVALQTTAGDRAGVDQFLLETEIPRGRKLRIEFGYRLGQSLVEDPFIMWTTTRYVRYARHEINVPKGVACTYQDVTVAALLERDVLASVSDSLGDSSKLVYASRPEELIFPGSAFIFMLRKENSSS